MNALAKTSDFLQSAEASEYYDPPLFRTHSKISDLCDRINSSTAILASSAQVKTSALPIQAKTSEFHLFTRKTIGFQRNFKLLQQWEGVVEKIGGDTFVAIISDKKTLDNPNEEVEIFLSEVDPEDMAFVRPGALFYWSVGYEDGIGVPRQRVSRIRFKRMAGLTSRDIARAEKNAIKLKSLFTCSAKPLIR